MINNLQLELKRRRKQQEFIKMCIEDDNSPQLQKLNSDVRKSSCEVERFIPNILWGQGEIKSGGVEDHLPRTSPVDTSLKH